MDNDILLLSEPTNFAVVHLPNRKFPGVVCQGDTLYNLVLELNSILDNISNSDKEEAEYQVRIIRDKFAEALQIYEKVCAERGISLPYKRK